MEIFGKPIDTTTFVLLLLALVSMFYFAVKEYRNRQAGGHADYKALIVSIGVLGTFIGIFIGLWQFDTANIANSVPALLEGLKLAFATSILGMLVSVVLASLEKADSASFMDEAATLASISGKLDAVPAIAAETKEIVEQLKKFRVEVMDEQKRSQKFIEGQFVKTNKALDIAIKTLAEGATSQIIKALEGVITDFNNNLTKQFGDNFKQLNAAVHKLVEWQENYRRQVEHSTRMLRAISDSLKNSDKTLAEISRRNNEMIDIQKLVHATLKQQGEQLKMSGALIANQERLTKNLDSMMRDYEAVIKKTGQGIEKLTDSINKSVSAQSQSLKSLADNIEKQLPRTLADLDSNLAGLTRRFATDYQSFLNRYQALVGGAARD